MENGIVSSYEDRAVSLRNSNVKNQCDILSNLLISEKYFEDSASTSVDGELSLFSNIYSGRILVINKDYKIIFDTYDLDKGKVIISEESCQVFSRPGYQPV